MTGYYLLVIFLAVSIAFSLSVTLLFNVKEVVVSGVSGTQYDEQDIAAASNITKGDNLVRMKTEKIEKGILGTMLYVDDVKVRKGFPDKVYIDVTPSKELAYVECKGGYMLVSEGWRILKLSETPQDPEDPDKKLIVVKGFSAVSNAEKTVMESIDKDKNEALKNILDEIKKQNIEKIVSIDITDKYDVMLNYDNRICIKIEKPEDVEYKLRYAYQIIKDELRENKTGYLIYRNSLGYSYVSEEEYERINGINSAHEGEPQVPDDIAGVSDTSDITNVTESEPPETSGNVSAVSEVSSGDSSASGQSSVQIQ